MTQSAEKVRETEYQRKARFDRAAPLRDAEEKSRT